MVFCELIFHINTLENAINHYQELKSIKKIKNKEKFRMPLFY